jgi:hypothetical protein
MIIAILLWTAAVALVYYFGGALLGLLTPGAAWLQANPDFAAWIEPAIGVLGTLGVSAALIVWLGGALIIALVARLAPVRRLRESVPYDVWRGREHEPRQDRSRYAPRYDDDDDRDGRRGRRRRRDDDDNDDDDD